MARGGPRQPLLIERITDAGVIRRFIGKVRQEESGAWRWIGAFDAKGYGKLRYRGSSIGAHRIAYAIFVGTIPDGFHVDHIDCDRSNVCPTNLRLMSAPDNSSRDHRRRARWDDIPI